MKTENDAFIHFMFAFLAYRAMLCSARYWYIMLSVCLSDLLFICNGEVPLPYRLGYFESNWH